MDISLISCIEEDEGIVLQSVVHPLAQLLLGDDGACRVVRETEVDDVDRTALRQFGNKAVLSRRGHISHVAPAPVTISAAATYHHVRVDVDRIDGIGDADEVIPVQQLLEVARVTLGSVVDEDLVETEAHAARCKVVLHDSFTQEFVSLLGSITSESVSCCHLVDGLMHRLDDGRTERLCDITDTERDDVGLGVHHLEGIDLLGNVSEQVVVLQVQKMYVY